MVIMILAATLAVSKGNITLHLVDSHGKPIAGREVWIAPTNSTKPIKPYGVQTSPPSWRSKIHAKTDKNGDVVFKGIKNGRPMMVIASFGPRFKSYLEKQDMGDMDYMQFEGAVYAGKPAKVVLANDYAVEGTVTDALTGAPLADVPVTLSDTITGHMSGYPGTTLDETKTDSNGRYTFTNLPNCIFDIQASPKGESLGVESKTGNEPWQYRLLVGGDGDWAGSTSMGVYLKSPRTRFDFRVSKTAVLQVVVQRGKEKSLRGWDLTTQRSSHEGGSGFVLDYEDPNKPPQPPKSEDTLEFQLIPGTYQLEMGYSGSSTKYHSTYLVATVTLKSGEHRRLVINLSDVVAPKKR